MILILNFLNIGIPNQNDFGQQWQDARLKMRTRSNRGISTAWSLSFWFWLFFTLLILIYLYLKADG